MNNSLIDDSFPVDAKPNCAPAATGHSVVPTGAVALAVALLFGWLALCNAAIGPLTAWLHPSDIWALLVYMSAGCFISQLGLLAAWNVWGPPTYWWRVAIGWGVAAILYGVLVVAAFVSSLFSDSAFSIKESPPILVLPLVSIFLEAPLWALKTMFGARFFRGGEAPDRPLAISDFLVVMVVAGVALALARLGRHTVDIGSETELWASLGVIGGIGAIITLTILPLLALTTTRVRSRVASLILTALVVIVLGVLPATVAYLIHGGLWSGVMGLVGAFVMPASAFATIAAAFGVARLAGYRFQFGKPGPMQSSVTTEGL